MGKRFDLAFANPSQPKDGEFLARCVARQGVVAEILAGLGEITTDNLARHRLIVGGEGMGKSTLLRRIAIGVRDNPALAGVLIPLRFREEQYNVHNLHIFWRNCLHALTDWFDESGQEELADRLESEVALLDSRHDDSEGSGGFALFTAWCNRESRRPLLLVDNIDLILNGLKEEQGCLRRICEEAGGMVVIGASTNPMAVDSKSAFHEFFQVDTLEGLSRMELLVGLRQLAGERVAAREGVPSWLGPDPGRIHTLYDLGGGTPQTLMMLHGMAEMTGDDDVMRDLARILEPLTPCYKARVEGLAAQSRVVFDTVALHWNPVTAAEVAIISGLGTATVSTQLDRLQKEGIVEKVAISTTSRAAFHVRDRAFGMWYLLRHAPRRQRRRLRGLCEFLRRFYASQEVGEMAGWFARPGQDRMTRATSCLAVSEAVVDQDLRNTLRYEARLEMERHARETGLPWPGSVEPEHLYAPRSAEDWFRQGYTLHITLDCEARAEVAYRRAMELDPNFAKPWNGLGSLLQDQAGRSHEAEAAYRRVMELDPKNVIAMANLAYLLLVQGERREEAESCYHEAMDNLPAPGSALLQAFHAIIHDNFGKGMELLNAVLAEEDQELFSSHQDDLLRLLRLTAQRGYGEKLIARLAGSGLADHYWPLAAAFDAYLHGEARLGDVNPEVRGAARRILGWLRKDGPLSAERVTAGKRAVRRKQGGAAAL